MFELDTGDVPILYCFYEENAYLEGVYFENNIGN